MITGIWSAITIYTSANQSIISKWIKLFHDAAANVFGLCVRTGFGAQSFILLRMFIRSTKLQVYTSARLTQNPCYLLALFIQAYFLSVLIKS